jgi:protein-disulfide isomerase
MVTVFRNFPLSTHPNAVPAAKAAYCAGQQSPAQFWQMHDWLFTNQNRWASASATDAGAQFRQQALTFGVDGGKYDACLTDAKTEAAIQRDMQEGSKLGVRGTPAFFLQKLDAQGQPASTKNISGALPFDQFDQTIKSLLN